MDYTDLRASLTDLISGGHLDISVPANNTEAWGKIYLPGSGLEVNVPCGYMHDTTDKVVVVIHALTGGGYHDPEVSPVRFTVEVPVQLDWKWLEMIYKRAKETQDG